MVRLIRQQKLVEKCIDHEFQVIHFERDNATGVPVYSSSAHINRPAQAALLVDGCSIKRSIRSRCDDVKLRNLMHLSNAMQATTGRSRADQTVRGPPHRRVAKGPIGGCRPVFNIWTSRRAQRASNKQSRSPRALIGTSKLIKIGRHRAHCSPLV